MADVTVIVRTLGFERDGVCQDDMHRGWGAGSQLQGNPTFLKAHFPSSPCAE